MKKKHPNLRKNPSPSPPHPTPPLSSKPPNKIPSTSLEDTPPPPTHMSFFSLPILYDRSLPVFSRMRLPLPRHLLFVTHLGVRKRRGERACECVRGMVGQQPFTPSSANMRPHCVANACQWKEQKGRKQKKQNNDNALPQRKRQQQPQHQLQQQRYRHPTPHPTPMAQEEKKYPAKEKKPNTTKKVCRTTMYQAKIKLLRKKKPPPRRNRKGGKEGWNEGRSLHPPALPSLQSSAQRNKKNI